LAKLEPLNQRDPKAVRVDAGGRKLAPQRNKAIGATLVRAWQNSQAVDDQQVAAFQPTTLDALVAEALLNGETGPKAIGFYCGVSAERVKRVLHDPVAMAWLSRTLKSLFTHRIGMIDSALFQRSMTGDPGACKLMYERLGALSQDQTIRHVYSGGVNVSALSLDDLKNLVKDKGKLLDASFKVIEREEAGVSAEVVPGAPGDDARQDALVVPKQSGEGPSPKGSASGEDPEVAAGPGGVQGADRVSELSGTGPGATAPTPPRPLSEDDRDRKTTLPDPEVLE
jgi:hypothetical protein